MIGQKGIPATIGGIERHVEELSANVAALGIHVTVYVRPWYAKEIKGKYRGVELVYLPSFRTKNFDAITHTFLSTVHAMRSDADILHYHGVGPALLSWLPRLFTPAKRVVVTFHCIDRRHEKWGFLGRLALRFGEFAACKFSHETIAVSRTLQHYAENLYRSDVQYIPNGVAVTERPSRAVLKKMGLEPGSYILVVTRFVRHKGVHTILAAWEKIQNDRDMRDKRLVLVGGSSFTESYVHEITEYAGRLKRVHLLGVKHGQDLASLYHYASLFVHASLSEGLPIILLEAMHYGVPVLASDIPEHMELIAEHGWKFRANSPESLAREMKKLLKRPQEIQARAAHAEEWVHKHFRWEDIASETASVYKNLSKKSVRMPLVATTK